MRRRAFGSLLVVVAFLAGCGGGSAGGDGSLDREGGVAGGSAGLGSPETVVSGLEVPWGLAFVDDQTFFVTERPGRVRVVRGGELQPEPALELAVVDRGEGGLLGIALHPTFPAQRFAYLYYTASDGNRVSRFSVGDDLRLSGEEVLLGGIPAARFHDGGRLAFGPDGTLYVSTGDARQPHSAADRSSVAGKILRLRPDGSVPPDNPFPDSPVYAYGHRNPQGFDWAADGRLYASEHGPTGEFGMCCHDEINLVHAGAFYGWPFVAGRVRADEGNPPEEPVEPVAASGSDTWAPAGVAVHDASGGGTAVLVATLAGERLLRFDVSADPSGAGEAVTLLEGFGRLRAAEIGPDGCLYLTTSNTDGRGRERPGDDRVLRSCFTGTP